MIVPILYSPYTKKEDARDVIKMQRKSQGAIIIGLGIVLAIMHFTVVPRLFQLYDSVAVDVPFILRYSPIITFILIALAFTSGLYLFFTSPNYSRVDAVTNKYKSGEMIKTREIIDHKFEWILLAVILLSIAYLVTSIILPVYSLTNQYK